MKTAINYNNINWKRCLQKLRELQFKLLRAFRNKDMKRVEMIQLKRV